MAKKHRNRKPKVPNRQATRSATRRRVGDRGVREPAAEALVGPLRHALRDPDPTTFWLTAAPLVAVLESPGEFAGALPEGVDLLQTFIEVDIAETTALLHMVVALTSDDLMRARALRALRNRRQPVPPHVSGLADAVVSQAQVFSDLSGDNHLVELTLPGGASATLIAYVSRVPRLYLKDAFFIGEPLEHVTERFGQLMNNEAVNPVDVLRVLELAQSRAALQEALDGIDQDIAKEPEEGDQWPMIVPLVHFTLSRMPEGGGAGYDVTGFLVGQRGDQLVKLPPDLDDEDLAAWLDEDDDEDPPWIDEDGTNLIDDFLASPDGASMPDGEMTRLLVAQLLALAAVAEGDPVHWCGAVVGWVLDEALPLDPMAPQEALDLVPTVLPALVAWAHTREDAEPEDIENARVVMDELLPQLPQRRAHPRMQAARLEALFDAALQSRDHTDIARVLLIQQVGSEQALAELSAEPLPAETLVLEQAPSDLHPRLREIDDELVAGLEALEGGTLRVTEPVLGPEFVTACRRFLTQAATRDPDVLRRRASTKNTAAAVAWIVGRGNGLVGHEPTPVRTGNLLAAFGVKSTPSTRAESLQRAAALPQSPVGVALASPDLLVASARQAIIDQRDELDHTDELP